MRRSTWKRADDGSGLSSSLLSDGGIYTAQVGGTKPVPGFVATASDFWTDRGNRVTYSLSWYQRGRFWTGLLRDAVENSLATVRADYARNAVGAEGLKFTFSSPPGPPIGADWQLRPRSSRRSPVRSTTTPTVVCCGSPYSTRSCRHRRPTSSRPRWATPGPLGWATRPVK